MKKIIVTTSWDDGNKLDVRLSDLLIKYGVRGTFYPAPNHKKFSLTEEDLKRLSRFQEIGAHTMSHPHLTAVNISEAKKEIIASKEYLEELLGEKIKMFCYPYGEFSLGIKNLAKEAEFFGARTVEDGAINFPTDFFEFGTTLHVYPLAFWEKIRFLKWSGLAKKLFERVLKEGDVYHLWGHSWEIEKHGLWSDLESVLKYIANRQDCFYLTNSETLEKLR
ncbi:MAG: polysaccharide deacetylase family protein [Candidatus Nealsonbacteria bacterium]